MNSPEFWYHKSGKNSAPLTRTFLKPIAFIYQWITQTKLRKTKPVRFKIPVICVGNIVMGGAGKTPIVKALYDLLYSELNLNPCILMRGYKGRYQGPLYVNSHVHDSLDVGDEALLYAKTRIGNHSDKLYSVCVSKDRKKGAKWIANPENIMALKSTIEKQNNIQKSTIQSDQSFINKSEKAFDLILMDDGLQNPALFKDINILVIDEKTGFGNGEIFPSGPLRESLKDAVKRIDAIVLMVRDFSIHSSVLTKSDKKLRDHIRKIPVFKAQLLPDSILNTEIEKQYQKISKKESLQMKWLAFCGIGRPLKFYDTLKDMSLNILEFIPFPDHHSYSKKDLSKLYMQARKLKANLITTEKDWVRLSEEDQKKIMFLPIKVKFESRESIQNMIQTHLKK